jgi:outer membrane protein TolC
MLDEENKFLFAGVNLSIPLYTGGKIDANIQKTRIELEKTSIQKEKTQQNIATELENCHLRIEEARLRIESAQSTLVTTEKAFTIAETTTRDGLTTQLQLKDMRFMYDQSMINYYAAVYDFMEAYFDWEQAVGSADR